MPHEHSYPLSAIADWQLKGRDTVSLPELQRGFVWKPHQTENLWDSLLRGFPVGTFILAPPEEDENVPESEFELLDGQQRATAIAFGFFDPWAHGSEAIKMWRVASKDVPIIWLDLARPENNDARAYVFRLITRSHPWGYERKDNQRPLSATDRRKFLLKLKDRLSPEDQTKRCGELPLTHFWPWDAVLPVPLAFLMRAVSATDWTEHLKSLCRRHFQKLETKHTAGNYLGALDDYLKTPHAEEIQRSIVALSSRKLPAATIDRAVLEHESLLSASSGSDDNEAPDDIETLFIRINSAGTQWAGEELIYSIYKSILRDTVDLVESAGQNFLQPSRLLSLATRVVQADLQREGTSRRRQTDPDVMSLPTKVRVKDFRRLLHERRTRFKDRLRRFITTLRDDNIFKRAQDILVGKAEFQLPAALAADLARRAPEIIFILVYRLHLGDDISNGSEDHRKVLGFITALSWFGRGERLRDHDACLRHVWKDLLTASKNRFWRRGVLTKAIEPRNDQLVMLPLARPSDLEKHLLECVVDAGTNWDELEDLAGSSRLYRWYKEHYEVHRQGDLAIYAWRAFLDKLWNQRGLVLYAQRESVAKWFCEFVHFGTQNLEDTNCPWDWDHIHPQNLIKRKWGVDRALKDWHSSIGNLRVWPLELNRSDSDTDPSEKLGKLDPEGNSFYETYELATAHDIREASFITDAQGWCSISKNTDVRKGADAKRIRKAIVARAVEMYRHWFENLRLREFFPLE